MTGADVLRPAKWILYGVLASNLVWALPGTPLKSVFGSPTITLPGIVAVGAFYGVLVAAALVGAGVGSTLRPSVRVGGADWASVYRWLSIVSIGGVALTYLIATKGSVSLIVELASKQQFNLLRRNIPYSAGLATLRYASIPAAAIAIDRVIATGRLRRVDALNGLALLGNAALSSRLALILAGFAGGFLILQRRRRAHVRVRWTRRRKRQVAGLLGLAFVAVVASTWSRTGGYYRSEGFGNPVAATYQEVGRYMGTGAQVAAAVESSGTMSVFSGGGSKSPWEGWYVYAVPTYLDPSLATLASPDEGQRYREVVKVNPGLTTNSVIAEAAGVLGVWSLFVLAPLVAISAGFVGHFARYRSPALLVAPVAGYALLELWRVWLFNAGVIHFIVLALLGTCAIARRAPGGTRRTAPAEAGAAGMPTTEMILRGW